MPANQRHKTKYPGVYWIEGEAQGSPSGKKEKIFYILYRKEGKLVEEKAGRQFQDKMTAARASNQRAQKIKGLIPTNEERREAQKREKEAEVARWTLDRLWAEYKAMRPDLKGIITDGSRYAKYLKPKFGNKTPDDIFQLDVDRLRIQLLKKKSPQTVKHVLALLRRIVRFGAGKGYCKEFEFKIEIPKVQNDRTEDLTAEQVRKLLKAIDSDSNKKAGHMMKMALFTGMRRGEILRLKWDDVDFERGFIHIRNPKGGYNQKIPLNDKARELLKGVEETNSPYVFPGPEGKQKAVMNRYFTARVKKAAGLPKSFRPMHGLRHTYASMLASSGKVDMYTLQKLLTHKDPRMTQRYAHLRDEALRRASGIAGDIIDEALADEKDKVIRLEDRKQK